MVDLTSHSGFRAAHPREEHFVPLYVAAGAGENGSVRIIESLYGAPTFAFGLWNCSALSFYMNYRRPLHLKRLSFVAAECRNPTTYVFRWLNDLSTSFLINLDHTFEFFCAAVINSTVSWRFLILTWECQNPFHRRVVRPDPNSEDTDTGVYIEPITSHVLSEGDPYVSLFSWTHPIIISNCSTPFAASAWRSVANSSTLWDAGL